MLNCSADVVQDLVLRSFFAVQITIFPVVGPVTICSAFGDPRGQGRIHHGIDICAPMGTPVLAELPEPYALARTLWVGP